MTTLKTSTGDDSRTSKALASKPTAPDALTRRWRTRFSLGRYSGLYIWAALIVLFAFWVPDLFLTKTTFKNLLVEQSITAILAVGLIFPLATGVFDLSIGSNLGLGAAIAAVVSAHQHQSPFVVVVVVLVVGIAIGLVNGVLVAQFQLNSFIVTLGTGSVLAAVGEKVTNNQFIYNIPNSFQNLASRDPLGIPVLAIYLMVLAVACWYLLEHTPVGRRMQATGAGPEAARLAGVATVRLQFWSLVVSAVVASLAGLLLAAKLGSVSPTVGQPYLLPAFAAVFLGTTQFMVGKYNVWGTLLAIFLLATGVKGLQLAGAPFWITDLFNGAALVVAIGMAALGQRPAALATLRRLRPRRSQGSITNPGTA